MRIILGTLFNISAYDDEDFIETTLVEGSIQLNLLQNGKLVQHVMKPNEKLIYNKKKKPESKKVATVPPNLQLGSSFTIMKNESVTIATVDPKYDIAWKDHRILFKKHSMEEVIRMLGRYYNVQFVVKNLKVMDSEITGMFSNEQLPQVMEYLKIASGIKYYIVPATPENGEIRPEVVEIWK